jgi:hypothetical protein
MGASRSSGAILRVGMSALALVATTLSAEVGRACSCGDAIHPLDADVIFQGEAVEVHQPLHLRFVPRTEEELEMVAYELWFTAAREFDRDVRTVLRVNTAWKGRVPTYITIHTRFRSFEEGRDYVVHATMDGDELHVAGCTGGRVFPGKAPTPEYAANLGPGTRPSRGARGFPMFWRHLLLPATMALPIAFAGLIHWRFAGRRARARRA